MLGAKSFRNCTCLLGFVVELDVLAGEGHRKRFYWTRGHLSHQAREDRRVNTPAQKNAQRNVAYHLTLDAIGQQLAQLLLTLFVRRTTAVGLSRRLERPIARELRLVRRQIKLKKMRRRKLIDTGEDRLRTRHVEIGEVVVESLPVYIRRIDPRGENALNLGRENKLVLVTIIVERLNAEVVAREHDLLTSSIQDRKSKHAIESFERSDALTLVEPENHFRVCL